MDSFETLGLNIAHSAYSAAKFAVKGFTETNEEIRQALVMQGEAFRDNAPTTAEEAAKTILDGVRAGQWRILLGEDAKVLDRLVREDPEGAYSEEFYEQLRGAVDWRLGELSI